MKLIIRSSNNKDSENINKKMIGTFYSQDRFYTLLNGSLHENLSKKSKFLSFIVSYLFQSSNFKHMPSISNGKTKGMIAVDVFSWLSIIGFVVCFFAGFATPLISAFVDGKFNADLFFKSFKGPGLILLAFALFFLIITIAYLLVIFKIKKKNQKLLLKDYVLKKLEFILKFKSLLKASAIMGEGKKPTQELLVLEKTEVLTDIDRWLFLQIMNLSFMLFKDFNLSLQFDNLEEAQFNSLQQIVNNDFKNLAIVKIKE